MIFWIIAGALTALVTGILTAPLHARHPRLSWILIVLIPLGALGLYLLLGNPRLAG